MAAGLRPRNIFISVSFFSTNTYSTCRQNGDENEPETVGEATTQQQQQPGSEDGREPQRAGRLRGEMVDDTGQWGIEAQLGGEASPAEGGEQAGRGNTSVARWKEVSRGDGRL